MIIYNVTVNVEEDIAQEWLEWMKNVHIPEVIATGCFKGFRILRIIQESNDTTGVTYAIQYECNDLTTLDKYFKNYASELRNKHNKKYGDKALAYRTVLEEVL
ncbi:MAG: DUF4286 family protein [Flammeovirgaceae bacterium]